MTIDDDASFDRQSAVRISTDRIEVVVVPEMGAKIVSLKDLTAGREWIYRDERIPLRLSPAGTPYGESSFWGWDECFPAIAPGPFAGPGRLAGKTIPDHGEMWSKAWSVSRVERGIVCEALAPDSSYRLSRQLTFIDDRRIWCLYELANLTDEPLVHGWSAHPLVDLGVGLRIEMDATPMRPEFGDGCRVIVESKLAAKRGPDAATWRWPLAWNGSEWTDLSTLTRSQQLTDKVFAETPADGIVRLVDLASGARLTFHLDRASIPFLGVCSNAGVTPQSGPQYWLAIEPTMASCDDLTIAAIRGHCGVVPGNATATWSLELLLDQEG